MKSFFKSIFIIGLVVLFVFGTASDALAARSGGRMGGGSFRAPSRSYSAPRSSPSRNGQYRSRGYGYGGGGFGFPFIIPFFGFGGGFGGLFSIFIVIALANFLIRAFQNAGVNSTSSGFGQSNSMVSVAQVQVGLMARARDLQKDLDAIAKKADTGTASGRAQVLQETTLAVMRNPEYWVYGCTEAQQTDIDSAESRFNQLALMERSKFSAETLSNVDKQLKSAELEANPNAGGVIATQEKGDYIVVTIVIGTTGRLDLPKINDSDDMRQALQTLGSVGGDRLLAIEVLWTPQAKGDTLSTEDVMANYPNFKLL